MWTYIKELHPICEVISKNYIQYVNRYQTIRYNMWTDIKQLHPICELISNNYIHYMKRLYDEWKSDHRKQSIKHEAMFLKFWSILIPGSLFFKSSKNVSKVAKKMSSVTCQTGFQIFYSFNRFAISRIKVMFIVICLSFCCTCSCAFCL